MATYRPPGADSPGEGPGSRPGATDPIQDALVRRQEEFRRFLVSVVGPAFAELRTEFRAAGREVRINPATSPGAAAEATILVSHQGRPEFFCAVRAAVTPERAVVVKRRSVPDPAGGAREEEAPLLGVPGPANDARTITRAAVVASVRADYRELRRALGDG